jgi:hypothetical protein
MTPVSPFQGLGHSSHSNPGRRYAAVAAALCPGLACDAPSGRKRVWRNSALVLVMSTVADSGLCPIAFQGTTNGQMPPRSGERGYYGTRLVRAGPVPFPL